MEPKSPKLLEDIRDAAAFVRQATNGKTLDDYHSDGSCVKPLSETSKSSARRSVDWRKSIQQPRQGSANINRSFLFAMCSSTDMTWWMKLKFGNAVYR